MIAGLDIGNGYVKGQIDGKTIKFPSVCAVNFTGSALPTPKERLNEFFSRSVYDQLDATFDSNTVKNSSHRFFGERALSSGLTLEEFDVNSSQSKAEVDLSGVLVLGALAGRILVDYWNEHKALPTETLKKTCDLITALPVTEYRAFRDGYAKRFMGQSHVVTIHNFEKPVRIEITFTSVHVMSEGEAAGYAMLFSDDKLMQGFLDAARKAGQDLEGVTPADLKNAASTIGLDIGEGTLNFAVFTGKRFNYDISTSVPKGYSQVLMRTMDRVLENGGPRFSSRKELAEFMGREPSALSRARYNSVKQVLDQESHAFAREIAMKASQVIAKAGGLVEAIYVFGGGAIPMKEFLYPELLKITSAGTGSDPLPLLYLDDQQAQFLNEFGLYMVAESLQKDKKKKAEKPANSTK